MKIRVRIDDETFEVEVGDLNARPVAARVGGELFEVWPEEAAEPALPAASSQPPPAVLSPQVLTPPPAWAAVPGPVNKTRSVPAPIPGVILSIGVKAGDVVEFGQELCVLEAMKMKNIIRANRIGKIAVVCVETGAHVQHGQTLIEFVD